MPAGVRPALAAATARLAGAGIASPRVDAELLAAHVLGVTRGRLPLVDEFSREQAARYLRLVEGRVGRVPVQHLTGVAPFRRLSLAVGPGVFVPRPETELLVEWGLACLSTGGGASPLVVDLCSGSGAIALAVADECRAAEVVAVERDRAALAWLTRNVADHGHGRVAVVPADVTVAADAAGGAVGGGAGGDAGWGAVDGGAGAREWFGRLVGRVDLVLCNPPYVPDGTAVPPEVADHDPAVAVFGGGDGLEVIRPVVALAAVLLRPGGRVGIEHDDTHGDAVTALLRADGRYRDVRAHADLAGRPRFATAVRGAATAVPGDATAVRAAPGAVALADLPP